MQYCKRCLYPLNHPLNIIFDDSGVCSGCRIHEEKDTLDWQEREQMLVRILERYRNPRETNYDCIIPVDGGKDSYFIVHTIKNVYKMNPLLVSYNKQYNTMTGIRNLQYLKSIFGCDTLENTINPRFAKKLVQYSLKKMGSIYWHNHLGSKTFPVQVAAKLKIPLIIWGVHQGIDQVGMFSHTDEVEMTRKYRKEHDLMGFEAEDMINEQEGIYERDMKKFFYPTDKEIEQVGIRGIYLGNYIRWDSKTQHERMIKLYNYETMQQTRTFNSYDNPDCFLYSDLHDYIKFLKFGYGKATDHASREIRLKKMTREEGIALVQKFQEVKPKHLDMFLKWAEIDESYFFQTIDRFRDPAVWQKVNGHWMTKHSVLDEANLKASERVPPDKHAACRYTLSRRTETADENHFKLMHKGWIH